MAGAQRLDGSAARRLDGSAARRLGGSAIDIRQVIRAVGPVFGTRWQYRGAA
ncbi:hypothetical protein AB0F25_08655 [Streptomyces wedmorensis]|uniref:hypothetical protein n=1 Tax=Streptomyces wedmorensis TaxID=43759 RepID=UPI003429B7FD